jgi:CubicO group peptidase (beta-lactamase class C family)
MNLRAVAASLLALLPLEAQVPPSDRERVEQIEANTVAVQLTPNQPPLKLSVKQLMDAYRVPGLSIAVIDHYQIAWAKGYGILETGSSKPVTTTTLFQAGSISKPVAAAGALALVEQGKLALDEDVNQKLKTWKVLENDFTKTQKVTLRRLLSHTAGLTVHGFPGYDVDARVPTLVQILNGERPANTAPIRVDFVPGTRVRYSGGGVTIEQLLMMDVTGKLFPPLMRELVLDKVGMPDSSYEQPLPPARAAMTAGGTRRDGSTVHGRWHIYPEIAAAGLWTTPTDLAHFAIDIALSKQGKSNRVLSEKMARAMLTPVMEEAGLGFFLDKDGPGQFGHNGADEGFQALLAMNADTGQGVAVMANSDNGIAVAELVVRKVAKEYGWKYGIPDPNAAGLVALISRLKGADAALQWYDSTSRAGSQQYRFNEGTLNLLGDILLATGRGPDAVRVFQRNAQAFPKSSNAYANLGEAYVQTGQNEAAIRSYEKALELDPANRDAKEAMQKLKPAK